MRILSSTNMTKISAKICQIPKNPIEKEKHNQLVCKNHQQKKKTKPNNINMQCEQQL